MSALSIQRWGLDAKKYTTLNRLIAMGIAASALVLGVCALALMNVLRFFEMLHHETVIDYNPATTLAIVYFLLICTGLYAGHYYKSKYEGGNLYLISVALGGFLGTMLGMIICLISQFLFSILVAKTGQYTFSYFIKILIIEQEVAYMIAGLLVLILLIVRWRLNAYKMSIQRTTEDTSGNLGSARLASSKDITRYGLRSQEGVLLGKDKVGYLRMQKPTDRLILAPRGGGKTSSVLIPFLIDYEKENKLVLDIKGELMAVCGSKAIEDGRKTYLIDPFGVMKGMGFTFETDTINPLAYLKDTDEIERDRYISALAGALCTNDVKNDNANHQHFAENAQIIMEGILDFYTKKHPDNNNHTNLVAMHDWWLNAMADKNADIIKQMKEEDDPKPKAAGVQMSVTGKDESGGMKTTVYRQLQWLKSSSIRKLFTGNSVNLNEFIKGECDIYIVLPEDMVKMYSRLVRVILALVKVKLVQTPAQKLKPNYFFVLDELGQLGYSDDVEQVSNTLRARGAKIIASFQSMKQIEEYKDDTIFKGMPVKHFLGNNDIKTMEWIQKLAGKTTVLTENISRNTTIGARSKGGVSEGRSFSETPTDLIHFNTIREMPKDEQYVFIEGMRPIQCQKAYYFQEAIYDGRYNDNPLEAKRESKGETKPSEPDKMLT